MTSQSVAGRAIVLGSDAFIADGAGGKAAALHVLAAAGFAVPPGFVVLAEQDVTAVDDTTLLDWVDTIGGFPVAVRSSGIAEDLDDASFAGLYESYLGVSDLGVLRQRIEDCRASAHTERLAAYRAHRDVDVGSDGAVAVLVQRMVDARIAGVGFSIDPITGIEEHGLLEWCSGLGDRLVSGHVIPSRATVNLADGKIVTQTAGDDAAVLSDVQAAALAGLLLRVQGARHRPQDIEWAIDNTDTLWLLQSRPITAITWRSDVGELTDADFRDGGVSARVCTPLMFSLYENAFQVSMQNFWVGLHLLDPRVTPTWIVMHYGRAYWNVAAVKDRYANIPGYDERVFDTDLGIVKDYGAGGPSSTRITPTVLARALRAAVALRRGYRRQLDAVARFARGWPARHRLWTERIGRFTGLDDSAFAAELVECLLSLHADTERTYFTTIYYNTSMQSDFKQLIDKVDAATDARTATIDLMGGLADISHMAMQAAVVKLYGVARTGGTSGVRWERALAEFVDAHGFHADMELELTCPRWSEEPDRVRVLIEGMLDSGTPPADPQIGLATGRRRFETQLAAVRARVRAKPLLRLRLARALDKHVATMREYLVAREQMREFSSQCYAIIRAYVLEAGRRFTADGRLSAESDVFMLTIHEIAALAEHRLSARDVGVRVRLRRAKHDGYRDLAPPHELGGGIDHRRGDPQAEGGLVGLGCSPGVVEGVARVVNSLSEIGQLRAGDVLVTRFTDPGWTPALGLVAGVVTEVGGLLSHAAVIGREYGIPAVLNVSGVTSSLSSGQRIRVDGDNGRVHILETEAVRNDG